VSPGDFERLLKRYDPHLFVRVQVYREGDVRRKTCPPHGLGTDRVCIYRKCSYGNVLRTSITNADGWSGRAPTYGDYHEFVRKDISRFSSFKEFFRETAEEPNKRREDRAEYEFMQERRAAWYVAHQYQKDQTFVGGLPVGSELRGRAVREEINRG
jgi:hypothetical protein